jgi:hypothetical protein
VVANGWSRTATKRPSRLEPHRETHPRTAIGLHEDGTLTLAAVDGRSNGFSVGVTASELAGLFVDDGAKKAIVLDGGGSTTAFIRRPGDVEATLVNRPSMGSSDQSTTLVRRLRHPDRAARPDRRPTRCESHHRGRGHPSSGRGVDAAMNGVSISGLPVTWSMTGSGGTLGSRQLPHDGRRRCHDPRGRRCPLGPGDRDDRPDTFPRSRRRRSALRRGATVDAGSVH